MTIQEIPLAPPPETETPRPRTTPSGQAPPHRRPWPWVVRAADQYVYDTEDAQLIDAWNEWLYADIGSAEEMAAYDKIYFRLDQLINEQPAPTSNDAG